MAIAVTHPFVSAKGDGTDATLVRPSNWNEPHTINMASSKIIGRLSPGPGPAEELPVTQYMIELLNTVDHTALAALLGLPTTGDAKLTFKTVSDAGWVLANDGSIGDVGSGATVASLDTLALFTLFYNTFSDAIAPLQLSSGAATTRAAQGAASTAFTAKCRMVLPKTLGRAIIVAGAGAGLTNRPIGTTGGAETHQITLGEMPSHAHNFTPVGTIPAHDINHTHQQQGTFNSGGESADHAHYTSGTNTGTTGHDYPDHTHYYNEAYDNYVGVRWFDYHNEKAVRGAQTGGASTRHQHDFSLSWGNWSGGRNAAHYHGTTISGPTGYMDSNNYHPHTFIGTLSTTVTVGGDIPHNNMQPWTAWNVMIKL
jgi:microcystin-dependent protein